jgi:hypothetical protein
MLGIADAAEGDSHRLQTSHPARRTPRSRRRYRRFGVGHRPSNKSPTELRRSFQQSP